MNTPIILDNWALVLDDNPYLAPEQRCMRLSGLVTGHPGFPDGHLVTTGPITGYEQRAVEGIIIKTKSGSLYQLFAPAADYEAAFPNAKLRLFNTLREKCLDCD